MHRCVTSRFRPIAISIGLELAATLGCTASPGDGLPGQDVPTVDDDDDDDDDEADTGGEAPERESDPFEESLDVPVSTTPGCRKIDFLFVIDDSESMEDEQQLLIDGFPGFMRSVQETIEEFDHHVMVVTPSGGGMSFDPCENKLGAGRVRSGAGEDCGLLEDYLHGARYVDGSHEDLEDAFTCVADVGIDGDGDEKTVWALAEAITAQAKTGQCNDGFLREDAILVVTIISDEEDSPDDEPPGSDWDDNSPGDPQMWRDGLVAAKGGDEDAVVVLALVGDSDLDDGMCDPYVHPDGTGAEPGIRLRTLAESLPYGSWTSVCQDDYSEFFNQAVVDIDSACAGFTAP